MTYSRKFDLIIIGGGLAGLTCGLALLESGFSVLIIEKNGYPNHKVCGEYVSNEVLPYIKKLGIDPHAAGAVSINKFELSNNSGQLLEARLPLGGFGISRYTLDKLFYEKYTETGDVLFDKVTELKFHDNKFELTTESHGLYIADYVVGAHGKRSTVDKQLKRKFIDKKSPWLGVKAHYIYDFPENTVALHNFDGGYCGLSLTEAGTVNACYLTTFESFKRQKGIPEFEKTVMRKNPHLNQFFEKAEPVFDKPLAISQISFEKKSPVENHIFMIGDSAGLIHPLCGNGMAMAIHSAKIFVELFIEKVKDKSTDRAALEWLYSKKWKENFSARLKTGRRIQKLLLNESISNIGFSLGQLFPQMVEGIIKRTHGKPLIS